MNCANRIGKGAAISANAASTKVLALSAIANHINVTASRISPTSEVQAVPAGSSTPTNASAHAAPPARQCATVSSRCQVATSASAPRSSRWIGISGLPCGWLRVRVSSPCATRRSADHSASAAPSGMPSALSSSSGTYQRRQ
jgi:hypothetical protein